MAGLRMEIAIRENEPRDLARVRELILEAENFGRPFLETELLNLKKNTSLGLGKVFVAAFKNKVVGYISLGRRTFALMMDSIIVDRHHQCMHACARIQRQLSHILHFSFLTDCRNGEEVLHS